MTRHLQRRLRERSVLYLMGPQRVFDRVRSVPALMARLPRTTWDLFRKGKLDAPPPEPPGDQAAATPDFRGELVDAFRLLQNRCGDAMGDLAAGADWRLPDGEAGDVATRHLGELQRWLEARWDSKPRDTRALEWLAKHVPGGRHVTKLSETAPYLLVSASLATSFVTMGAEQVVIGGYLLTTWLGERLSDEVAAKTRAANAAIQRDFAALCDRQVRVASEHADRLAPPARQLDELDRAVEAAAEVGG